MSNGFTGGILKVNLSKKSITTIPIEDEIAEKYLGGKGYASRLLYDYLNQYQKKGRKAKDIDALGEENVVIFMTGPGTGVARFPAAGRYHVMALKSPLTGAMGSANSGGAWGVYLKFAGYDGIIVEGAADVPLYLSINNGKAELKDAAEIWGMTTFDTTSYLVDKAGDKNAKVACIGPAGEHLMPMAGIINDEHRAAGRVGMGAILGSKKLKAIVVSGKGKVAVAKPDELKKVADRCTNSLKENPVTGSGLPTYGTAVLVNIINNTGAFPFRNWQSGVDADAESISGETLSKDYLVKKHACWGCVIGCGRISTVKDGPFQVTQTEGPEYESIWALGASTGVNDMAAIIKANHYCDEFGMDTISLGSTIAAAMELNEKGYIPAADLGGLDLKFGNAAAMVEAVWRTAYEAGFGRRLREGSRKLCAHYGHPELSMSVKGLEMPAYDPRAVKGIGLNYATSNRGGCHVTGYTISPEVVGLPEKIDPLSYEGKATWVKVFQDFTCTVNSTVNCLFTTFALGAPDYADLLSAVTGRSISADDILLIGERIYNLERLINNSLGITGQDDTLPTRLLKEALPEGPGKGQVMKLDELKKEYYKLRGWDNGVPGKAKLKELGITG